MSDTIERVHNKKSNTRDILQEYFIPFSRFDEFVQFLKAIIQEYSINILNCTVRFVKATEKSFLNYAREDMFAFVLFVNVEENPESYDEVSYWSQLFIDKAARLGGSYYLPYHLFAPRQLVKNAYPQWGAFVTLKKKYDPREMFVNQLYRKYA